MDPFFGALLPGIFELSNRDDVGDGDAGVNMATPSTFAYSGGNRAGLTLSISVDQGDCATSPMGFGGEGVRQLSTTSSPVCGRKGLLRS
jgi:hypothetical protein